MNGKQLFCLSLILLSISMGLHWHKNKPKARPKKPQHNRVALNIDDLQLADEGQNEEDAGEESTPDNQDPEAIDDGSGEGDEAADGEPADGESTDQTTASATEILDELSSDPVIAAIRSLPRNPFEKSPYAELYEQLRSQQEEIPEEEEKKSVKLLTANFSATIGTAKELVAVIDSRLYRTGEVFQNKKITEIKPELVALESGSELFLLPKVGVDIVIDEQGNYTVDDSFHKN